jgi:hypothetical protein
MNYLLKRCQKSSYGGVYIRGGSTVCSAVYIRAGEERDKCEECGETRVQLHKSFTVYYWINIIYLHE